MYDLTSQRVLAGAAGAGAKLYVEDVFSTWLYTGNGSTQTITNGIDLAGKGGLVWIKQRSTETPVGNHYLYDTTRGAENTLSSNTTDGSYTRSGSVTSFSSSGFSVGNDGIINGSGRNLASWTFRKAAKFFDVVTFTTAASTPTYSFSHALGSTPGCIIIKDINNADDWYVWHRSLDPAYNLALNQTAAQANRGATWITTVNSTTVASSVTGGANPLTANRTYVAYLFAHDAGGFGDSGSESVVKCGSYTGNGSASGPTVTLGWEPQWLIVKRASGGTGGWEMIDNMRGFVAGGNDAILYADLSNAEAASDRVSPTGTGFQVTTTSTALNNSGDTYIYIAIRRGPMKTPTDATKVFSANTWTGTGTTQQITTGFFPDACLTIDRNKAATNLNYLFDNLRGVNVESYTNSTAAEGTDSGKAFTMTGLSNNSGNLNSTLGVYVGEFFRRAPGFFDVVAYTGTGVARTVSHNLGVVPELMIVKRRNTSGDWWIYSSNVPIPTTSYLNFNSFQVFSGATVIWNATNPTSSAFTVGTYGEVNGSADTFIAYLFASCPGISKVGSYTGTGTTLQVNCGFTSGARFVLIKRTDSTGDWYVWDSARGIVAGNDPYLLLNSTAAEVTGTDYVDTYSAGFEISSTAPAAINANGGSFIFLAVA